MSNDKRPVKQQKTGGVIYCPYCDCEITAVNADCKEENEGFRFVHLDVVHPISLPDFEIRG